MTKKKKRLLQIGFFSVVLILTFYSVLKGQDLTELIRDMKEADGRYLLLAVLCVLGFLTLQGAVIYFMLIAVGMKRSFWKCMLFSFTGYFYCSITPFQSGGPPAQLVNMKKDGIAISTGSIVILVMTFLFKAVLVAVAIWYLIFGRGYLAPYLNPVIGWLVLGLFLTLGFSAFLAILIFHPSFARRMMLRVYDGLIEKRGVFKRFRGMRLRIDSFMERYKTTASFFRTHRRKMAGLFLLTLAQRFSYFLTTYFVYRAFGLSGTSPLVIVLLQACISISVDLLPLPGGTGITEALFLQMFRPIFGARYLLPGMMLSRGITYYVQLFFCAFMAIIARFFIGRGVKEEG
jgi:uncharacterized protein (TIRG00374 family)